MSAVMGEVADVGEAVAPAPSWKERFRKYWDTGILVRVTNLGLGFILLTLVLAIGATNTGNNGLYILLAILLSVLVVSGVVSRVNVEDLEPRLEGPDEVFAKTPARFSIRIANSGRRERRAILVRLANHDKPMLFSGIQPGTEERRGIDLVFSRRGKRKIGSLLVYSGYPIGLFRKGYVHSHGLEQLVYPRVLARPVPRPEPASRDGEVPHRNERGRGHDIRNLREAAPGDDPRDIHWPQTARQGTLIVRERAADQGRDAFVVLDVPPGGTSPEAFEEAVSEAAGLVIQLLGRGDRVGLAHATRLIPAASGPMQRRLLLTTLALAEPVPTKLPPSIPPGSLLFRVRSGAGGRAA
ncbi:MAG: DUF58 domain-containing protein [Acidobacteria bacterium]|nr:DUF58 domain-containing protein [Acidobacteriota bacterium]